MGDVSGRVLSSDIICRFFMGMFANGVDGGIGLCVITCTQSYSANPCTYSTPSAQLYPLVSILQRLCAAALYQSVYSFHSLYSQRPPINLCIPFIFSASRCICHSVCIFLQLYLAVFMSVHLHALANGSGELPMSLYRLSPLAVFGAVQKNRQLFSYVQHEFL